MSPQAILLEDLHHRLVEKLEQDGCAPEKMARADLETRIRVLITSERLAAASADAEQITQRLVWRVRGFGVLEPLLQDPSITEIMVNGPDDVFVERAGQLIKSNVVFGSAVELRELIARIAAAAGRRIDESQPFVDARLPDGSRVNAIIPPLARHHSVLTIRKFPANTLTLEQLTAGGTVNQSMAAFLRAAILSKQNILISGSTGSGKTSTLNALGALIPITERLITIEDTFEMRFIHPHLVQLEARQPNIEGTGEVTIRTLLKNSLRMRPDRIIIGEVRAGEALDMLQAMNTGHKGSLTTIHANAPLEALVRLETMAMMADIALPLSAIHEQVGMAIHFIVHQERLPGGARRVVAISEVIRAQNSALPYTVQPLFIYNKLLGRFEATGIVPAVSRTFEEAGVALEPEWFL